MWSDFASNLLGAAMNTFGREVTYQSAAEGSFPYQLVAVFDAASKIISMKDGLQYSSVHPTLGVRLIDMQAPPANGDLVTVDGVVYTVVDKNPDGQGGAQLILQR